MRRLVCDCRESYDGIVGNDANKLATQQQQRGVIAGPNRGGEYDTLGISPK